MSCSGQKIDQDTLSQVFLDNKLRLTPVPDNDDLRVLDLLLADALAH